ncbi:MAG: recombinase family protein [Dehalococcoidia bacterium]|nr:recombinase family protein [Dehalococcoidia bacterium]
MNTILQIIETPKAINGAFTGGVRAAIYCRVSTDRQEREGASLDTQLRDCQRFCETKGFVEVAQYVEAESGLNSDRPEYQKVLKAAQEGRFDTIVVWRMDRLGRDTADYFYALKAMRRLGVDIHSATEPTDNPFVQGLFGLLGEEESRRLSFRVIPNKRARARDGKWNGQAPFGYDLGKAPDGKGSVLVPNSDAPAVEKLFRQYAIGRTSLGELTMCLAEKGHKFSRQGVRQILRNRAYVGQVVYGLQARSRFAAPSEPFEAEGLHPALVDDATFQQVHDRLITNRHRRRGGPHPQFLLSGLLRCGKCNRPMVGKKTAHRWVQYICSRRVGRLDCNQPSISGLKLEPQVKANMKKLLEPPKMTDVRKRAKEVAAEIIDKEHQGQYQARESLLERKQQQEERLISLENALLDGLIPPGRYIVRRDQLMAELRKIEVSLSQVAAVPRAEYDGLFSILDDIEWDDLDDEGWREILEPLVDRVIITEREVAIDWLPICRPLLALYTL